MSERPGNWPAVPVLKRGVPGNQAATGKVDAGDTPPWGIL